MAFETLIYVLRSPFMKLVGLIIVAIFFIFFVVYLLGSAFNVGVINSWEIVFSIALLVIAVIVITLIKSTRRG